MNPLKGTPEVRRQAAKGSSPKRVLFVFRNAEWLGVEYLSAVLKAAGHETDLLFDCGVGDIEFKFDFLKKFMDFEEQMLRKAKEFRPDLIAISCLNNTTEFSVHMARLLKQHLNVPVIVGGSQATFAPETLLAEPAIDMVCIGEGEYALLELVESLDGGELDTTIKNIWFKKKGMIIKNELRPLIQDLDSLPYPDKEIFHKYGAFDRRLYVMGSRGCPYSCTYCFNHAYKKLYSGQKYVRFRDPKAIIEEILYFKGKYDFNEVFFYDDNFLLNKAWTRELCELYKEKVGLPFKCLIMANHVDDEMVKLLKDAGCIYVDFGIESGNEYVRKHVLKRSMSNDQILRASKLLHKYGLKFTTLNMIGFPDETPEQMFDTVLLNQQVRPNACLMTTFFPFPDTELYQIAVNSGVLPLEEDALFGRVSYKEDSILKSPHKETITKIQYYFPLLVKFPVMFKFFRALPLARAARFVSIPFSTQPRNFFVRAKEQMVMLRKARKYFLS